MAIFTLKFTIMIFENGKGQDGTGWCMGDLQMVVFEVHNKQDSRIGLHVVLCSDSVKPF